MQWLNVQTALLRSPGFIGAEPVQRATWFCLVAWCAEQENGGVIEGAEGWGDRRWMQTCGVTKDEVREKCDLWEWNGKGLIVKHYPADKQAEVEAKREAGKKRAASRATSRATSRADSSALTEGKGNPSLTGRGRKGKDPTPPPPGLAGWLRGTRWSTIEPEKAWELASCRKAWEKDNK